MIIITFLILIFSAIIHEVSHGLAAEALGDDTARREGRITLNPIPHIDPMGTIVVPLLIYFATAGRFFFGAAKPVPVNFNNLRNPRSGMAIVSFAGPLSNFLLALLFAVPLKMNLFAYDTFGYNVMISGIVINLILGTFNLIPIPPLDGSKILGSLLPRGAMYKLLELERWGFVLVMIFIYTGLFNIILFPVLALFSRLVGINLLA